MLVCRDAWSPAKSCHCGRPASKCPAHYCKASASTPSMWGPSKHLQKGDSLMTLNRRRLLLRKLSAFGVQPTHQTVKKGAIGCTRATPLRKLQCQAHTQPSATTHLNPLAHECGRHVLQGWGFGRNLHIDCLTHTRCVPPQARNFILQQGILQLHAEDKSMLDTLLVVQ